MQNIFFQINNYQQFPANYSRDYHIPVSLSIESNFPYSSDIFYVQCSDKNNLTLLTLGTSYGELYDLSVIYSNQIFFYDQLFDDNTYLSRHMAHYFNFDWTFKPSTGLKPTITIDAACKLEVFQNGIRINLPNQGNGRYLFYQSSIFAVITDQNLCITGFVILGLKQVDYQEFVNYAQRENLNETINNFNTGIFFPMNNYECLIKKIFELNNIDLWKLAAYGYKINLIDDKFLISFSTAIVMRNSNADFLAIDIAALSDTNANQAGILLSKKIELDSLGFEEKKDYNSIWLYLSTVSDLSNKGILKP